MPNKRLYWALQVSGWGAILAINGTLGAWFTPHLTASFLATYGLCSLSGLLLSHAFYLQLKQHWLPLPIGENISSYIAGPIVLGTVQTFFAALFFRILLVPDTFRRWDWLPSALAIWITIFVVWTAILVAATQVRRNKEAERQRVAAELAAKDARLAALRNQVNPHFLFNSLNSIRALIYEDSAKAGRMVDKLANMLRYSLGSDERRIVTLAEELAIVNEYLDIEKIRFEQRLQVKTEVEELACQALLPSMLVQTLVENAVKHGIEIQPGGGTIRIRGVLRNGELQIHVVNPGTLKNTSESTHIGLKNASQQLALTMGTRARLSLVQQHDVVVAQLLIPQNGRP